MANLARMIAFSSADTMRSANIAEAYANTKTAPPAANTQNGFSGPISARARAALRAIGRPSSYGPDAIKIR
jgi:hypothetical protein